MGKRKLRTIIFYDKLSKIIIEKTVIYYSKAQNHRNEISHAPKKYRQYALEWNEKLIRRIEQGNKLEMIKYLRTYSLDISKCVNSYIRRWNITAQDLCKKALNEVTRDIRNYFARQLRNKIQQVTER